MNKNMLTTNVIGDYKTKHYTLHRDLNSLIRANVHVNVLRSRVFEEFELIARRRSNTKLDRFVPVGPEECLNLSPILEPLPRDFNQWQW